MFNRNPGRVWLSGAIIGTLLLLLSLTMPVDLTPVEPEVDTVPAEVAVPCSVNDIPKGLADTDATCVDGKVVVRDEKPSPITLRFAPELKDRKALVLVGEYLAFDLETSRPLAEGEKFWFESTNHHIASVLAPGDRMNSLDDGWGKGPLRDGQIKGLNPGTATVCAVVIGKIKLAADCLTVEVKRRTT